ncbi:hypothetical protein WA158_003754 [Blastocystis sp. Blastoise]
MNSNKVSFVFTDGVRTELSYDKIIQLPGSCLYKYLEANKNIYKAVGIRIERPGAYFKYIANLIERGQFILYINDVDNLDKIFEEFKYYDFDVPEALSQFTRQLITQLWFDPVIKIQAPDDVYEIQRGWLERLGITRSYFSDDGLIGCQYDLVNGTFILPFQFKFFKCVYNYLRTGIVTLPHNDIETVQMVTLEFRSLKLPTEDINAVSNNDNKFNNISDILTNRTSYYLQKMTRLKNVQLLYSSKKHENTVEYFHRQCDDQGPTITLIQVTNNNKTTVFGAFTSIPWSSYDSLYDSSSFLFTLQNTCYISPRAFYPTMNSNSIVLQNLLGPTFGNCIDEDDLSIHFNISSNFTSLPSITVYTHFIKDQGAYINDTNKGLEVFINDSIHLNEIEIPVDILEVYKVL